jgi:hypothetical protein
VAGAGPWEYVVTATHVPGKLRMIVDLLIGMVRCCLLLQSYFTLQTGWLCPKLHSAEKLGHNLMIGMSWDYATCPTSIFHTCSEKKIAVQNSTRHVLQIAPVVQSVAHMPEK